MQTEVQKLSVTEKIGYNLPDFSAHFIFCLHYWLSGQQAGVADFFLTLTYIDSCQSGLTECTERIMIFNKLAVFPSNRTYAQAMH